MPEARRRREGSGAARSRLLPLLLREELIDRLVDGHVDDAAPGVDPPVAVQPAELVAAVVRRAARGLERRLVDDADLGLADPLARRKGARRREGLRLALQD